MGTELKIPELGESITEVEIGDWLKQPGESVRKDEPIVTIESEKATLELPAPEAGILGRILKQKGDSAMIGETVAILEKDGAQDRTAQTSPPAKTKEPAQRPPAQAPPLATPAPKQPPSASETPVPKSPNRARRVMPSAERLLAERGLSPETIEPTGPGGRLLKEDILRTERKPAREPGVPAPGPSSEITTGMPREDEVVPMSRLRRTVAERLVEAQNSSALLTTFNEVEMTNVMDLRKKYGEEFHQRHKAKLGFMSFFVKACIEGLKQFPMLNAEVRGTNLVYHHYYDIGVAIGAGKGLVVPVLRNAERLSFAEIEGRIDEYARRARENKLTLEELQGGTFTITNGGVFGSLLSTPLINPPQSGILGMHMIQERPVAREGAVVIRPMMYLALTYDHRLVDGREAVLFLKKVKEIIETPARMLLEL